MDGRGAVVHRPAMTTRRELYEAMGARNAEAEREARRIDRRWMLRAGVACMLWCAAGLFIVGWAFHTTDARAGRVAFWAGLLVGNGGMLVTLLSALTRRGREAP